MTRINVVHPSELVDQHLQAEYRELPRIFGLVEKAVARGWVARDYVPTYRMGTGHVLFFYNKLGYLKRRQGQIIDELRRRGRIPNWSADFTEFATIPDGWWGDWQPCEEAIRINRERLNERLADMALKTKPAQAPS